MFALRSVISALSVLAALSACSSSVTSPPPPPPCEQKCQDGVAVKALREMAKLAFNITLQGKPVGPQDVSTPCPLGGTARIVGTATSNAEQGSTFVDLTYTFDKCGYLFQDDDAEDNYRMTLTGVLVQNGTLAVQPTATNAVILKSDSMILSGTVYDPPIPFEATCRLELGQNGNKLTGKLCDRDVGVDL